MNKFNVYSYNLPKVSQEGESIPTEPCQPHGFDELDEANVHAEKQKDQFDRVVVIGPDEELIGRFSDGQELAATGSP